MEVKDYREATMSAVDFVQDKYGKEYAGLLKNFRDLQLEQYLLFARKNHDYGMKNITAGSDLETEDEVKFVLTGLWFRISDKVNRWKNIIKNGWTVETEPFLDTLQDIANYAIIAEMVARGLWTNEKDEEDTGESKADSGESESPRERE